MERFALGETSIVHQQDRIAVDIDLSSQEFPPFSHIRYFRTTSAEELDYESFAISHPQNLRVAGLVPVEIYALAGTDPAESISNS